MTPQPPHVPDRQDAILDAAFHVFAGYGYKRVTMEDIAQAAGLSRTALYLHFRNKEDIFRSLSARYFDTCLQDMERALSTAGPAETVLKSAFVAKDGKFMDAVLGTPHGRELMDAGFALSADIASEAEARMADLLGDWAARRSAGGPLGAPALTGSTIVAALKGLKSSARDLAAYRAGQAHLARMVALALGR
jgi:AcrR family transcriptional regulator